MPSRQSTPVTSCWRTIFVHSGSLRTGSLSPSASRRVGFNEIVHGKRRITAGTALRLSRYFGTTDRFWLNLQTRFDLEKEKDNLGTVVDQIQPLRTD